MAVLGDEHEHRDAAHEVTGKKEIGKVQNICGESLYQGLLDLGLVGTRRRKVPYMGRFYAQAGMLLRVMQTG